MATVFNPAPAAPVEAAVYPLCDYVVPNETGGGGAHRPCGSTRSDDARRAGDALLAKGVGTALITLGEKGALFHARDRSLHVPAVNAGCGRGDDRRRRSPSSAASRRRSRAERSAGGDALRLRRRGNLRDARRHRALDACARRGGSAHGAKLSANRWRRCAFTAIRERGLVPSGRWNGWRRWSFGVFCASGSARAEGRGSRSGQRSANHALGRDGPDLLGQDPKALPSQRRQKISMMRSPVSDADTRPHPGVA